MSVTALHVPFKKDFEPIVRHLENIAVAPSLDEAEWTYYRVKNIEPFFPKYTSDVIPNGQYIDVEMKVLKLPDNVLGQVRIIDLTNGFEVQVNLPRAMPLYTTKDYITTIDQEIVSRYPWLTELTYLGDEVPFFRIFNKSGSDGSATIRFVGFKYILEKLPSKPREFTVVYIRGVLPPGTTS